MNKIILSPFLLVVIYFLSACVNTRKTKRHCIYVNIKSLHYYATLTALLALTAFKFNPCFYWFESSAEFEEYRSYVYIY